MALREDAMRTYRDLGMRSSDRSHYPLEEMHPDDGPDADPNVLANTFSLLYSDDYHKGASMTQTHSKVYAPKRRAANTRECPLLLSYGDSLPRPSDGKPPSFSHLSSTHALPMEPTYDWSLNSTYENPRETTVPPPDGNNRFDISENWEYSQKMRPRVDLEQAAQDQKLRDYKDTYDPVYRKNQLSNREALLLTTSDDYMNTTKHVERPNMLDVSDHFY
jgi:hypothetical protein